VAGLTNADDKSAYRGSFRVGIPSITITAVRPLDCETAVAVRRLQRLRRSMQCCPLAVLSRCVPGGAALRRRFTAIRSLAAAVQQRRVTTALRDFLSDAGDRSSRVECRNTFESVVRCWRLPIRRLQLILATGPNHDAALPYLRRRCPCHCLSGRLQSATDTMRYDGLY